MTKVLIDISDEIYEYVKQNYRYGIGAEVACKLGFAVAEGTLLTDNATNGDVIQTMYPHYTFEIESFEGFVRCSYDGWYIRLPICWWDAPYKVGDINDKL